MRNHGNDPYHRRDLLTPSDLDMPQQAFLISFSFAIIVKLRILIVDYL